MAQQKSVTLVISHVLDPEHGQRYEAWLGKIMPIAAEFPGHLGANVIRPAPGQNLWSVIIQAVMSWFNPDPYHPAARVLAQLTAPVLRPARRIVPPISGVDLSPMLVVVALIFVSLLLQDFLGVWTGLR